MTTFSDYAVPGDRPLPVLLLVDVSGSMGQHGKLAAQNESIGQMIDAFLLDSRTRGAIRIAIIAFGGESAELLLPPTPVEQVRFVPPAEATGRTPLGTALRMASDVLVDPAFKPQNALKATMVLTSDGIPTDDWEPPLQELLASRAGRQADRIAVAIGEDADEAMLVQFCSDEMPVLKAHEGQDIVEYFRRITLSVTRGLTSGSYGKSLPDLDLDDLL
jgi:uncharacterized protein YegL